MLAVLINIVKRHIEVIDRVKMEKENLVLIPRENSLPLDLQDFRFYMQFLENEIQSLVLDKSIFEDCFFDEDNNREHIEELENILDTYGGHIKDLTLIGFYLYGLKDDLYKKLKKLTFVSCSIRENRTRLNQLNKLVYENCFWRRNRKYSS